MDDKLKEVFPGEDHVDNVIAVKTHLLRSFTDRRFNRAILIVRDPYESARAEYNRRVTNLHTGAITEEKFRKQGKYFYI